MNQVRYLTATSTNRVDYSITTGDFFTYSTELVYLVQFGTSNSGPTPTLNINGLGQKTIKKQSSIGVSTFEANDLNSTGIYNLIYDGSNFRVNQQSGSGAAFTLKYKIVSDERISVPAYSEYLLYGDLEVNGTLDINPTGKVVLINGALNVNGGTVSNSGNIHIITFATASLTKFSQVISPMTGGITYSINHNLNTPAPIVNTWDETTGELITIDVVKKTDNLMDISSSTTLSSMRIVII